MRAKPITHQWESRPSGRRSQVRAWLGRQDEGEAGSRALRRGGSTRRRTLARLLVRPCLGHIDRFAPKGLDDLGDRTGDVFVLRLRCRPRFSNGCDSTGVVNREGIVLQDRDFRGQPHPTDPLRRSRQGRARVRASPITAPTYPRSLAWQRARPRPTWIGVDPPMQPARREVALTAPTGTSSRRTFGQVRLPPYPILQKPWLWART